MNDYTVPSSPADYARVWASMIPSLSPLEGNDCSYMLGELADVAEGDHGQLDRESLSYMRWMGFEYTAEAELFVRLVLAGAQYSGMGPAELREAQAELNRIYGIDGEDAPE